MAKAARININLYIGQQLRARRIVLGLSQDFVGKGIGVAAQQVQKYEKGTNALNAKRLYEFAQFLKVPVTYFYVGLDGAGAGKSVTSYAAIPRGVKGASEREGLEVLKSFKRIKDYALRKRIADLLRTLSLQE